MGLSRSTYYWVPRPESAENLWRQRKIAELYLAHPFYGSRKMAVVLGTNPKRAQRPYGPMGIEAHYTKPNLSRAAPGHHIYPYLLRRLTIERVHQVWSIDITYIPLRQGFLYLVAIVDWYSRYVLSWELSNTLDVGFCSAALATALDQYGRPEIWNSDQGSQFTSTAFLAPLLALEVAISMAGRGRALDNVFIERVWRSLKYELIYPGDFGSGEELREALIKYWRFYNHERPHQALGYATPADLFGNGARR